MRLHVELIGESLVMILPLRCQHLPRNFKRFSPIFKRIFNSSSLNPISMYVRFFAEISVMIFEYSMYFSYKESNIGSIMILSPLTFKNESVNK